MSIEFYSRSSEGFNSFGNPLYHIVGHFFKGAVITIGLVAGFIGLTYLGKDAESQALAKGINQNQVPISCEVSDTFPSQVMQWCDLITKYADKHDFNPDLIAAMIWQESGGNPDAYSTNGAVGLMQVMPSDGIAARFMCKNGPCFANRPTIERLQDPEFNIKYGTRMLDRLVDQRGSVRDALKAYGPMDVDYYYADIVLELFNEFRD